MNTPRATRIVRHPVWIGAGCGALIGTAAGVLLPILAPEPVPYGYTRADLIAGWAGLPLNNLIHRFTNWGWAEAERRGFILVVLTLNGAFWGAAGVAVTRALRGDPGFRRIVTGALLLELPLAIGVWAALLPGPFGGTPVQNAFELAHLPGLLLLQEIGLCCGYYNSVVIRDWGGPYRPSALGMSLLVTSNIIMFVALAYAGRAILGCVRSRRGRRRIAAPVAEG
jgi:hypothetical protein